VLRATALSLLPVPAWRVTHAAEPVRSFYDVFDNAPFINGNGTAIPAKPGLAIELIRMAAQQAHDAITLTRTPWERGLYLIQTGQADAIFASSFVKERLRYGVYPMKDGRPDPSKKLFDQSYRLYVRAGSGVHWDGMTLSNLHGPVGATPGYAVIPVLRAMGVAVEEEPNHVANLRKLVAGRLGAYAEIDNHVRPLLHADPAEFGNIVELSPPLLSKPYFLMFSKIFYAKAPEVAEHIWDAIAVARTSPAYQALLQAGENAD
jgi:polar amino acid transport system substrate-binding protein